MRLGGSGVALCVVSLCIEGLGTVFLLGKMGSVECVVMGFPGLSNSNYSALCIAFAKPGR